MRSLVATLVFMAAGVLFAPLTGITAVFGLPRGIAPPTTTAAAAAGTHFGVVLLAGTAAVMAVLGLAARALTGKAFAPTPTALQQELVGAEVRVAQNSQHLGGKRGYARLEIGC